jgi:hypothetical protein
MGLSRRLRNALGMVLGGLLVASGCSGRATTPTSFKKFNARDGTVQCQVPSDWDLKSGGPGGSKGFLGCRFQKGGATLRIEASLVGSLFGDMARAGGQRMGLDADEIDPELTPVGVAHKLSIERVTEDLGELDVKSTDTVQTGLGDTRISEFTYSGTFGAQTHGYLATALGHEKGIRVICTCPEKDWETLKPAFEKVIKSLDRGQVERS